MRASARKQAKVGRMAGTDYNRVASRAFRRARDESRMNQGEFAIALSDAMGLRARRRLKQSTLSGWELGTRQVPAGALLAAATVASIPIERALGRDASDDLARRLAAVERLLGGAGEAVRDVAARARRDLKAR